VAIDSLLATIWSKNVLTAFDRATILVGLCNRDFEGDAQLGNTVKINSVSDPTISSYAAGGTLTYEDANTAAQSLLIDQGDSFSFKVDDIKKAQAAANVIPKALMRAGRKLALSADTFVAGLHSGVSAANDLGTVSITTSDLAYQYIVALNQKLDEADAPADGRWCVVPPWYMALLRRNSLFLANAATQADTLLTGKIGKVLGMDVYMSNNLVNTTGDDWACMAGVPDALSFANQVNEVEDIRLQTTFASAVRGLHVYGAKLVYSSGIARLVASIT
jgi:hypothetical protein